MTQPAKARTTMAAMAMKRWRLKKRSVKRASARPVPEGGMSLGIKRGLADGIFAGILASMPG